jgi:hypothetical protein
MSQENVAVVRGLLAHGATRFALLLSLLALGALGAVACDTMRARRPRPK